MRRVMRRVHAATRAVGLLGFGLALLFVVWLLEVGGEWEEWRERRR
jgi:hypothetical protein